VVTRACVMCGESFEASRRDAKFCSPACRKAHWRGVPVLEQPAALPGPVTRETRAILAQLGVDDSDHVARAALACAAAMDSPHTPPGALVGLSKALPESLAYLREVYRRDNEED
jgi:hypothetical protein